MFISEIRDLKIRLLEGEKLFSFDRSSCLKNNTILHFISKKFKNDIISGSLALSLYGFITDKRPIGDIDILIKDKSRYTDYEVDSYDIEIPNRLGYKRFEYKKSFLHKSKFYDVDFFIEEPNTKFDVLPIYDLKVHNPIQIITYKINMHYKKMSYKHGVDLYYIFNQINKR